MNDEPFIHLPGYRHFAGHSAPTEDPLCVERDYRLIVNGVTTAGLTATPTQVAELGAGHALCEGYLATIQDVSVRGETILVTGEGSGKRHPLVTTDIVLTPEQVHEAMGAIVSDLWRLTGGAHCAVLLRNGTPVATAGDIGRHNAVDKVVGHAQLNDIDRSRCCLACTGRQPAAMVRKAALAGIPVIISKAATTDAGIRLADKSGITLVCRARNESFTVYTHPRRIQDARP